MTNEIIALLDALHDGKKDLEEVERRFKEYSWPTSQKGEPRNFSELSTAANQDPDPYISGSYDDVASAYHRGRLTDDQYKVLVNAITESKRLANES